MRIGLVLKRDKPEAQEIAARLHPWLAERGHKPVLLSPDDEKSLSREIDLLVVLGGDGTLLHGASLVSDRGIPILGINLGHLGFLASCAPAEAALILDRALRGELQLEERMRLRCDLRRANGEVVTRLACNDVVVSQGAMARLIELDAFLDGRRVTRYRADGLIVSTPTGSTAYNMAAGGPILTPELNAFVLTPICPHTLTNRPLVAPASARLTIRLAHPVEHILCTVDGQWAESVTADDAIEISLGTPPLFLFRSGESYFEVLQHKLGWGT